MPNALSSTRAAEFCVWQQLQTFLFNREITAKTIHVNIQWLRRIHKQLQAAFRIHRTQQFLPTKHPLHALPMLLGLLLCPAQRPGNLIERNHDKHIRSQQRYAWDKLLATCKDDEEHPLFDQEPTDFEVVWSLISCVDCMMIIWTGPRFLLLMSGLITGMTTNTSLYQRFLMEREEVLKHKWIESEKQGYDMGFEKALVDWVKNHRKNWVNSVFSEQSPNGRGQSRD